MKQLAITIASAILLASCDGSSKQPVAVAPTYVRAHDIKQLMATVVQPQADVFWQSAGALIDEAGEHDLSPTTEEGWLRTRSAAATVAAMGNLLQTSLYAEGRRDDWMQFSNALVKIGIRAERAAANRNSEAILQIGGTLYNVCEACHQAYLPGVDSSQAQVQAINGSE